MAITNAIRPSKMAKDVNATPAASSWVGCDEGGEKVVTFTGTDALVISRLFVKKQNEGVSTVETAARVQVAAELAGRTQCV